MLIYWITLSIGGIALLVMCALLFRHWKEIRLLNPNSIAEERERQKRDELLLQRLSRVKSEKAAPFKALMQKGLLSGKTAYHAAYLKLVKIEKLYKQAKAPFTVMAPSVKDRIKLLLDDARSLTRDMKWAEAERRYLEVLTIDERNTDAYKGIGLIYLKQKLYPQARETFDFLLRSKKADDTVYASLAEIAEADADMARAEEMRRKAVEFRPRLAHRHAELASLYLEMGQPSKAWSFAKRAAELEPKSAKYLELFLETAILLGDRNEAGRRYDKLRLLSDDRQKLQSLKERIDAIASP
jgi:tetratricopeptide (TPR) repeat protein